MTFVSELLDRAATGRQVSILTALALMKTDGQADPALEILDDLAETVPSQAPEHLNAAAIAAQAIREATQLRGVL